LSPETASAKYDHVYLRPSTTACRAAPPPLSHVKVCSPAVVLFVRVATYPPAGAAAWVSRETVNCDVAHPVRLVSNDGFAHRFTRVRVRWNQIDPSLRWSRTGSPSASRIGSPSEPVAM
jgi:hypothetical protein